ncbi:hypothetical protein GALMADRAFT_237734, partial [Galerina marginata CBS 339.88]
MGSHRSQQAKSRSGGESIMERDAKAVCRVVGLLINLSYIPPMTLNITALSGPFPDAFNV